MKKYNRDEVETWDILVYSGTSIFSKLIQKFTKSRYSHVWVAVVIGWRRFIVEATATQWVRMVLVSSAMKGLVWMIKVWLEPNMNKLFCKLWDKYDFVGLLVLALEKIGITIYGKNKRWFCSELVSNVFWIKREQFNSPADIVEFFDK